MNHEAAYFEILENILISLKEQFVLFVETAYSELVDVKKL